MTSKKLFLTAAAMIAAAAFAAAGAGSPKGEAPAATPDRDIGLSPGDAFAVPEPAAVRDDLPDPGDGAPLPQLYPGAPPLVTHLVADYLPLTRQENLCLDCHLIDEAEEGDPTPVPASHRTDLRNTPDKVGEGVVGARYYCVTCHVAATGAELLVANRFAAGGERQPE